MFPGAAGGGDSRGAAARGLAAFSTGIRRQTGDPQQIPNSYPGPGGFADHRALVGIQRQQQYAAMQQQAQHPQFGNLKRSLTDMERQQLQSALFRSVRQRVAAATTTPVISTQPYPHQHQFNYASLQQQQQQLLESQHQQQAHNLFQHHQQPLVRHQQQESQQQHAVFSPLSPAASSSQSTCSATGVANFCASPAVCAGNPTRSDQQRGTGGDDALRTQQHLEIAQGNGFFPCTGSAGGVCDNLPAPAQSDCGNATGGQSSSATMLREIARCLLDDDEENDEADASGSGAAAPVPGPAVDDSDWSEAIEELLGMTEPQPRSSSASAAASNVTTEEVVAVSVAAAAAGASSSASVSDSTPHAVVPLPRPPLQQQPGKPPLSPCTPSSSTSSTVTSVQSGSPAAPWVSRQQVLSDAAAAIADGSVDHAATAAVLTELKKGMNPASDLPEQRLQGYLVDALLSRINPEAAGSAGESPVPELCSAEHLAAVQRLHEVGLFFRLGVSTANLAIIDAARGLAKIHIVDFDVGSGSQYVALLLSMGNKHRAAVMEWQKGGVAVGVLPVLKITAVADPLNPYSVNTSRPDSLRFVEERIANEARRLGIRFEFRTVRMRTSELSRAALGLSAEEESEAVVVNLGFLLSKLADESVTPLNPRDELLRRVKSLSPDLVTVVEQEMNCNTASFLSRFREASSYYAAALESLEAHMPSSVPAAVRAQAEAALGRKAANAVAAEGWRRVERCEVLGKWRLRLGMAGFKPAPLSRAVVEPIRKLISGLGNRSGGNSNPSNVNVNVSVEEEGGGIVFGWKERRLTAVSAWRC